MSTLLRGVAIITGAGSGIGQHTAYTFANYGVRQLALCDIRPGALEQTSKELKSRYPDIQVLNLEVDTSKEDSVDRAVAQTVEKFSRLDIAINNAGIGGGEVPTHDLPFEKWQKTLSINLDGVFLCQRAQIRQMLRQEPLDPGPRGTRGVIVNMSSMMGLVASAADTPAAAYCASKHGVVGLTKNDAVMYASKGVRLNAICPGFVMTPLLEAAAKSGAMDGRLMKVPQGRISEMGEIADAIAFLASPMSSYMTGHSLPVDGGYTVQ